MKAPPEKGPTNLQAPIYTSNGDCANCAGMQDAQAPNEMAVCANCGKVLDHKVIGNSGTYCSTACMMAKERDMYVP